jgi:hypothetical protein
MTNIGKAMNKQIKRGSFLDGIASNNFLDSSGERINIEGMDISSLASDGTLNYEHDRDKISTNTVGKILQAKKIFNIKDCDNKRHRYYWNKIKTPFIYVMGELFDSVGHLGAQEIAAMLRYDEQILDKEKYKQVVNFSIEGSRLDKKVDANGKEIPGDGNVNHSIARKVTITTSACNKSCIAEKLDPKDLNEKDQKSIIDDIINKAETTKCEIIKSEDIEKSFFASPKSDDKREQNEYKKWINTYHKQNKQQGEKHPKAPNPDPYGNRKNYVPLPTHQPIKKGFFAPKGGQGKPSGSITDPKTAGKPAKLETSGSYTKKMAAISQKQTKFTKSNLHKAIIAGCNIGTPGTSSDLSKEDIKKVCKSIGDENYSLFTKKEELTVFLKERLPNLTDKKRKALEKAIAYMYMKKREKILKEMAEEEDEK